MSWSRPILETERLVLREFAADDLGGLCRILCDRETMRSYPMSFDETAAEEWIARNQRRYAMQGHGCGRWI
jgi:RimJ/RimL family protein N-acetyltransferase